MPRQLQRERTCCNQSGAAGRLAGTCDDVTACIAGAHDETEPLGGVLDSRDDCIAQADQQQRAAGSRSGRAHAKLSSGPHQL